MGPCVIVVTKDTQNWGCVMRCATSILRSTGSQSCGAHDAGCSADQTEPEPEPDLFKGLHAARLSQPSAQTAGLCAYMLWA